mmetsp:Transcript_20060/g.51710  ORF Transcript_20060/g.51710 Transcript_20060/m.51710 type:complete len:280 (-) Transcript_20060:283-1122(-)
MEKPWVDSGCMDHWTISIVGRVRVTGRTQVTSVIRSATESLLLAFHLALGQTVFDVSIDEHESVRVEVIDVHLHLLFLAGVHRRRAVLRDDVHHSVQLLGAELVGIAHELLLHLEGDVLWLGCIQHAQITGLAQKVGELLLSEHFELTGGLVHRRAFHVVAHRIPPHEVEVLEDALDARVVVARLEPAQDRAEVHRLLDDIKVVVELEALPVNGLVESVSIWQFSNRLDDVLRFGKRVACAQGSPWHAAELLLELGLELACGVVDLRALLIVGLGVLPD